MSTEYFGYQQHTINDIADIIQDVINNNESYDDFYYTPKIINLLQDAIYSLRKGYVYVQRINLLVSGDDGEESFKVLLDKDLNKIKYPVCTEVSNNLTHSYWCSEFHFCKENQYKIIEIVDKIEQLIESNEQDNYNFSPKTIDKFTIAIETLRTASIYVKFINQLYWNDMNEKLFIDTLTKELEILNAV